ncbi:sugar ABC transporter substrate-binding protein [Salmonella enterica subsp. enterica]|nr:sugar ABC transporter substrate-binding protein [Salmonella enterica subsp. enterica]EBS4937898.1 sugar ABC transporter substrate-binding protein [Salmonella enterica subsp. enterica serovar Goverdhan]EKO5069629.1 iron transporter [Salmonella enterica]EBU7062464.1 sugar ABC transporter substrate-binding protein [Salmonella enterica subsp. enterica serovar Goverdhan]ECD2897146.1 sugar ABC transporter substrate-binding protein [Salmonella enterica subsp. enterica serovar Goverdhan]
MKVMTCLLITGGLSVTLCVYAKEYPVGGPVQKNGMEIAVSYLVNIETTPMPSSMVMGKDVIHLETDVHATQDNKWGFPQDAWIPYLSVDYVVQKVGDADFLEFGQMLPMSAADGAHYAHSVKMKGSGTYRVSLKYTPPDEKGYARHTDRETGLPQWFSPFTETFTFTYPQG